MGLGVGGSASIQHIMCECRDRQVPYCIASRLCTLSEADRVIDQDFRSSAHGLAFTKNSE